MLTRRCSPGRAELRVLLPLLLLAARLDAARADAAVDDSSDGFDAALLRSEAYARLHPAFHIAPRAGWLNDPVGLFKHAGVFHVFFQHNPRGAAWGDISWAHVASRDLATWTRLPLALAPGPQRYDADGAFSGSVTVVDGAPVMMYTCASEFQQRGYFYQQQCQARPADGGDLWLRAWRKWDAVNPLRMAPPPGGTHAQWRDPAPAWRDAPGGPWRMLLGTQLACRGAAALYESLDFLNWTFAGVFAAQPAAAARPPGAACSQFGDAPGGGAAWETPTAFPVGPQPGAPWALLYGDQISTRTQWQRSTVLLGSYASNGTSVRFDAAAAGPQPLDGGEVYAAQTMLDDATGRRILFAWVQETPPNATRGWQGVLTLPRVLGVTADGRTLTQRPAAELAQLRQPAQPVLAAYGVPLNGNAAQLALPRSASRGMQREIEVTVKACPPSSGAVCEAGVLLTTSAAGAAGPRTVVTLRAARGDGGGEARATLTVDRGRTGGVGDARAQSASYALPADTAFAPLRLRLFVDHSVVEAFAGAGAAVVTSRVYPDAARDGAPWGVALFGAAAAADVRVWELGSAWA